MVQIESINFADKWNVAHWMYFDFEKGEKNVGKGENGGDQDFPSVTIETVVIVW